MDFYRAVLALCPCSLCVLSSLLCLCLSSSLSLCISPSLSPFTIINQITPAKLSQLSFNSRLLFHFIASVHPIPSFFPSAYTFTFSVVKIKWKWESSAEILRHQVNELIFSIKIKKHLFSWPAGHEDTSKLFCTSEYAFIMVMCLISPSLLLSFSLILSMLDSSQH